MIAPLLTPWRGSPVSRSSRFNILGAPRPPRRQPCFNAPPLLAEQGRCP